MIKRSVRTIAAIAMGWCVSQLAITYWPQNQTKDDLKSFVPAAEGDVICRPDGSPWNASRADALVMVIDGTCPYCEASKPFMQELEKQGLQHGIPTTYVIPTDSRSSKLAGELEQLGKSVVRVDQQKFGVTLVPTFLRVNDEGTIQANWRGSVPDDRRGQAIAALTTGRTTRPYDIIPSTKLLSYARERDYQIVTFSQIGGIELGSSAKVIPLHDIGIRAPYELDRRRGVVLHCDAAPTHEGCESAARSLAMDGFAHVTAAGLPSRPDSCPVKDIVRASAQRP